MKKIVILDGKTLGDVKFEELKKFGEVVYYDTTSMQELEARVKDANVILTNKVVLNKETLAMCKDLELICETATGFNNIDIEFAKGNNIAVTNVAGYSTNTVVQHTFAMALSLIEKIGYYDNYVKSGDYARSGLFTSLDMPFNELEGKIWGIIGLGNIGKRVAKVCEAFGINVIYYSTSGKNSDSTYERVNFEELLSRSDIISIHAPLNNNTAGLINYEALSKMKESAILVNMGRGPIVIEKDLAKALNDNIIAGAALDVFEVEPMKEDNILLKLQDNSKVILTPHIAWASIEARERLFNEIVLNIKAFYQGEIRNRVEI